MPNPPGPAWRAQPATRRGSWTAQLDRCSIKQSGKMIRPWFRQAAVPWKTTVTQTRASGENRVSTKLGVLHTPDFLAVTSDGGRWLLDVRPAERIEAVDRGKFAASAEAALACGWRYGVVGGWQPHVMTTLDTLSAQRRPLADRLGLMPVLLAAAAGGPVRFADLVDQTAYPAVARAFAIHLIWHRKLAIDLAQPLGDDALVWPAAA